MTAAYEANGQTVAPEQFYAIACDPRRSVAVEACAGAGKTWMLVSRILRALLAQAATPGGVQPQEILAITFTKKAAGEMRERLTLWLEEFAGAGPEELDRQLRMRGIDPQATPGVHGLLSNLYQQLLACGRPVQIRTFHSWFAALLRNAPLAVLQQLELPASYELLEDDSRAAALVWPRFYAALQASAPALAHYQALVAEHGRSQAHKALEAVLARRTEFLLADAQGVVAASVQPFAAVFTEFAGLDHPDEMLGTNRDHRQKLRDAAAALGAASAKTFSAAGVALEMAVTAQDWQAAIDALFTATGTPRKFSDKIAGIERVRVAQDLLQRIIDARAQHAAWQHQQRLAQLARVLLAEWAAVKREHGWVDMPDLERAALTLLAEPALGAWVQQRLDATVRHLLIDEFQDTNPLQWQALSAWLQGYAGAGGGERPGVFIVGDPKQSIYRFRRAEPQVFRAAQAFVGEGLDGARLACDHTRRNAPEVLAAVNAAMAGAMQPFRTHTTDARAGGAVLRLPQVPRSRKAPARPAAGTWRDSLRTPREAPEDTLRTLEARQAAAWIASELEAGARSQDFMVLSRKRASLGLMLDELRALHVPAALAEKAGLMDCCEVQDVVALLDALVSPRHSLSLARALRSPLFGLDDDDLVAIALLARRHQATLAPGDEPPGWLDLLQKTELLPHHLRGLHAVLLQYGAWARTLPPHDALSAIYHQGDVLRAFAAAAPAAQRASVLANLGALLQATLALDGARYTTTYGFVRALKAGTVKAPAQTPAEAVQLLTVHGAKGLEASTVLLLDTDAQAPRAESMGVLVDWPGEAAWPQRLVFMASEARPCAGVADTLAAEVAARGREEVNALYVAMTRARQRLVLSSCEPHAPDPGSWWQRLLPLATPLEVPHSLAGGLQAPVDGPFELPELPPAPTSRAQAAIKSIADANPAEARVGLAMHRLLEWQPLGAASGRFEASAAQQQAVAREFALQGDELAQALALARRIREGEGAWAWDAQQVVWQGNEVELAFEGQVLRLDRLVQRQDSREWWVLDYKSAAQPGLQAGLREQMLRYQRAVQALHPGASVRLAFLSGDGRLQPLSVA